MDSRFIAAIDQGTTSTRVVLVDGAGAPVFSVAKPVEQYFPQPGWVEHDAAAIARDVEILLAEAVKHAGGAHSIAAIGITNQRETTVLWDRMTGEPLHRALVWQDRRTADVCRRLEREGHESRVRALTGLVLDPYFSATKIAWLLDNIEGARARAERGELCCGTIDSWLVWKLTGGVRHVTDASNAARTLLLDLTDTQWNDELLGLFDVPAAILPEIVDCQAEFGATWNGLFDTSIPILGMAGDQQAASFGQACFETGMVKATFGTGCFLLANAGEQAVPSANRLLTTVAWRLGGRPVYALEGSIFMAGATVQWLRDGLGILDDAAQSESIARSLSDTSGVYLVPAFAGLGAPYWDAGAQGAIVGLTRGCGSAEIVRAGLEAVAYQTRDLLNAVAGDMAHAGLEAPQRLRVDGGMVANSWLMQFLADQLGIVVERARYSEATAMGAAYLAGLEAGVFDNLDSLAAMWQSDAVFEPALDLDRADMAYAGWQAAVARVRSAD